MIIVNTETVPGKEITAFHGLVQGNTIRAKHVGRDIGAALKNLVGGELQAYTELLSEARAQALERMTAAGSRKTPRSWPSWQAWSSFAMSSTRNRWPINCNFI